MVSTVSHLCQGTQRLPFKGGCIGIYNYTSSSSFQLHTSIQCEDECGYHVKCSDYKP